MTPEQFAYWLKGFYEMENPKTLSLRQTKVIKDHLDQVFEKRTPKRIASKGLSGSALIC